jgi:thiol-disulfide isomerase/thioredoxin
MARLVPPCLETSKRWCAVILVLGTYGWFSHAATLSDDFAGAESVSGDVLAITSNEAATAEPLEPAHAGEPASHSLWLTWTANVTGTCIITTSNSLTPTRLWMDTVLAVYTGTALENLAPVVSNDDEAPFKTWSTVAFRAYAGETFRIAVDSLAGSSLGNLSLRISNAGPLMAAWTASDLDGNPISSSSFGNQILLVDFWETTCGACVEELPDLVRLYQTLHPRGFSLVGLSGDPNVELVHQYFTTNVTPPYPIGMVSVSASKSLGGPSGYPTKLLVDQEHKIVARYLGAAPITDTTAFYAGVIEPLLRGPPRLRVLALRASGSLRISWATANPGYGLEWAADPGATTWNPVTANVATNSGNYIVTIPTGETATFFRLRKQ